jgi:hypothetical protein
MALLTAALLAANALVGPPREPVHVIGGAVAGDCQWPSTVLMSGCSGTLVHPEIILYAAHCPDSAAAHFGVTGNERSVGISSCEESPMYPAIGFDYKYCRLSEPVTDVPIVPVLMGCERDQLPIDRPVVLVGFGNTSNSGGGFGTKRWIDGTIAGFPDEGRKVGVFYEDVTEGICNGDSGGSGFVQLDDGSWRLFGIASSVAGQCGGSSQHIPAYNAVAWVEEHSGIDITPCHDADGSWNPGEGCTGFPLDPNDGSGLSWAQGCGPGSAGPIVETCGPAFGQPQDTSAPTITIASPAPGAHDGPLFTTSIEIEASDDWGILDIQVDFAEMNVLLEAEPYGLATVGFPEGAWEIVAVARDWSGNEAMATVAIEVGDVPSATDGGSESGGPSTTDPATSGGSSTFDPANGSGASESESEEGSDTESEPAQDGAEEGCGCRSGDRRSLAAFLLLLPLFTRRRPSLRSA